MTLIVREEVPDPVWERATAVFDDYELGQLVFAITTINAWNRLNIAACLQPGHYRAGHVRPADRLARGWGARS